MVLYQHSHIYIYIYNIIQYIYIYIQYYTIYIYIYIRIHIGVNLGIPDLQIPSDHQNTPQKVGGWKMITRIGSMNWRVMLNDYHILSLTNFEHVCFHLWISSSRIWKVIHWLFQWLFQWVTVGHPGSRRRDSASRCWRRSATRSAAWSRKYEASGDQMIEIPWPWRKKREFHGKVFAWLWLYRFI